MRACFISGCTTRATYVSQTEERGAVFACERDAELLLRRTGKADPLPKVVEGGLDFARRPEDVAAEKATPVEEVPSPTTTIKPPGAAKKKGRGWARRA